MQQTEKIRSSTDQRYDRLLEGVAAHIMNAISASHQTASQVFIRYVDHSIPGESFHEWLGVEYRGITNYIDSEVTIEGVPVPQYEYGDDVSRIFELSPRIDGLVDDDYLSSLGFVAIHR